MPRRIKCFFFEEETTTSVEQESKLIQQDDEGVTKESVSEVEYFTNLPAVNIGEQGEVYDHIGITIHSAYQTDDKKLFVPEEMMEYCWGLNEEEIYIVMDFEAENLDAVEQMFQMNNFATINEEWGMEDWDIAYSGIETVENQSNKKKYWLVMQPGENLRTTVAIKVPKEYITENHELDLVIQPSFAHPTSAAKFRLKLETK